MFNEYLVPDIYCFLDEFYPKFIRCDEVAFFEVLEKY